MTRADGKTLGAFIYVCALGKTAFTESHQYSMQHKRSSQSTYSLLVVFGQKQRGADCIFKGVCACKCRRMHVSVHVCVCAHKSLFVYMPVSISFQQGSLCNRC